MSTALVFAGLAVLVGAIAWRPHGFGPTLGALAGLGLAALGGTLGPADLGHALAAQWRAQLTLASVMTMTAAAEFLGLLERLASWIARLDDDDED